MTKGRMIAAAALAALAAGCGSLELPSPPAPAGTVRITAIDRRAWDAPAESGLWRVEFDAVRVRDNRARAAVLADTDYDRDGRRAEVAAFEEDAGRELRAGGRCSGLARLASPLSTGDGTRPVSAVFKCGTSLF